MALYRVQVELAPANNNPDDKVVNTFHTIADDETAVQLFITQLTTFYAAIDQIMSSLLATSGHRVRVYNLADDKPRAPVIDQVFTAITAPAANTLPPEVALCISFQAPQQSGVPQARRRGRVFLGPWGTAFVTSASGRPNSTNLATISTALQNLLDASQAATTWAWAVYSPTAGQAIEVTSAWVDDEFDIQRRRGRERTTRTLLT